MDEKAKTILVVDDDESIRLMIGTLLERFRADLIFAASAAEAMENIERCLEIDLVVSDYRMGPGTGIEVLRYLRSLQRRIPFLLFTSEERNPIPLGDSANASYIRKPRLAELVDEVGRLLH